VTTPWWDGPFLVAVALLMAGSALKLQRPAQTAGALGAMGLPRSTTLVRAGAVVELVVGVAALAGTRAGAAAVALSYLAFTAFVGAALTRRVPVGSCGCFGGIDTPPSVLHIVVNLAAAASAAAAAVSPRSLTSALAPHPWGGVPFLLLVAAAAGLAFVALTDLPQVLALTPRRRP
jgi:hypothetical protein